jgi:hypothetical protein
MAELLGSLRRLFLLTGLKAVAAVVLKFYWIKCSDRLAFPQA